MSDFVLEITRATVVFVIFIYLCMAGRKENIRRQEGWLYIIGGFGLILFGMLIDITDNFPGLNRFAVIGDTEYQAFIEKVVGYLFGFFLLAIGFWKWIPTVIRLNEAERELKKSHDEMELRVAERTMELQKEITERKQAEEALQGSEVKYRGLFDESIAAIYVFDEKKNFLDSNQAGMGLLGYSREELLNMTIPDVDADPIATVPAHEQLLGGDRIINYEHRLKRKDGKVITCAVTIKIRTKAK